MHNYRVFFKLKNFVISSPQIKEKGSYIHFCIQILKFIFWLHIYFLFETGSNGKIMLHSHWLVFPWKHENEYL